MSNLRELFDNLREFVVAVGSVTMFMLRMLAHLPRAVARPKLIVEQIYNSGALSLVIIMICGVFIGAVVGLQGYEVLQRFGATDSLGVGAAFALLKELGPVVTALLFAGRAGTALASEIGLMRATDQLTAMEMMAVDPILRVAVPRFLGGAISLPLLAMIFIGIALYGVQLVAVQQLGVDAASFWSQMRAAVSLDDVTDGLVKSCVFGVLCSLIAVYEGYTAIPTAEGVGRATTRTVVISAVIVLMVNYMLSAVMLR
ncbi:MAG TPA: lipid asymmetry maintenance ABC transporter permease subunit MlaE [Povalibacter sp.]|jgi:phospholipid/cholesterol/gamma-HCH transport system permease protein|nr:lipid asymmetry maintenance ABC transporter permease subunit MlaE [Povalibacter sp.]